jgi:hypothetical protein
MTTSSLKDLTNKNCLFDNILRAQILPTKLFQDAFVNEKLTP